MKAVTQTNLVPRGPNEVQSLPVGPVEERCIELRPGLCVIGSKLIGIAGAINTALNLGQSWQGSAKQRIEKDGQKSTILGLCLKNQIGRQESLAFTQELNESGTDLKLVSSLQFLLERFAPNTILLNQDVCNFSEEGARYLLGHEKFHAALNLKVKEIIGTPIGNICLYLLNPDNVSDILEVMVKNNREGKNFGESEAESISNGIDEMLIDGFEEVLTQMSDLYSYESRNGNLGSEELRALLKLGSPLNQIAIVKLFISAFEEWCQTHEKLVDLQETVNMVRGQRIVSDLNIHVDLNLITEYSLGNS